MAFGKSFHKLKDANAEQRRQFKMGRITVVRKLDKKLHPRRKKLFHVGTHLDFLNFA